MTQFDCQKACQGAIDELQKVAHDVSHSSGIQWLNDLLLQHQQDYNKHGAFLASIMVPIRVLLADHNSMLGSIYRHYSDRIREAAQNPAHFAASLADIMEEFDAHLRYIITQSRKSIDGNNDARYRYTLLLMLAYLAGRRDFRHLLKNYSYYLS